MKLRKITYFISLRCLDITKLGPEVIVCATTDDEAEFRERNPVGERWQLGPRSLGEGGLLNEGGPATVRLLIGVAQTWDAEAHNKGAL
jgi:hypothetical protein